VNEERREVRAAAAEALEITRGGIATPLLRHRPFRGTPAPPPTPSFVASKGGGGLRGGRKLLGTVYIEELEADDVALSPDAGAVYDHASVYAWVKFRF